MPTLERRLTKVNRPPILRLAIATYEILTYLLLYSFRPPLNCHIFVAFHYRGARQRCRLAVLKYDSFMYVEATHGAGVGAD